MVRIGVSRAAALGVGIVGLTLAGSAYAQMPPEAAEIGRCVCMHREISRLSADMAAKMGALHRLDQRVSDLDARLRDERDTLNVNDPAAVERYKALLEERDAAWKGSVGAVWKAADEAVRRYDAVVRDYNGDCAHRLFDSALLRQVRATATCTAPGHEPPGPAESEYPPAPGYGPPGPPESAYPSEPGYGPPGPPESEYPPAPGAAGPPQSGFPPAPPPPYPPPR